MGVWIFLIFYLIGLRFMMGRLRSKRSQHRYLVCAGVVTALIMGLRGDNYTRVYDLRVYMQYYEAIAQSNWNTIFFVSDFEYGFAVLCKLLSYLSSSGQTIILFESILCVYSICHLIERNTENVFEAFFFFVTLGTMGFMLSGIRQSIAIAICLLSIDMIQQKKPIWFYLMVAIAYTIHQSALIFAIAYFATRSKFLQKHKWSVIPLIMLMMVFARELIALGISMSDSSLVAGEPLLSLNGIVPVALYVSVIAYQLLMRYRTSRYEEGELPITLPLMGIGLGIYLMRIYGQVLERVALYYTPVSIIGLADFTRTLRKGNGGRVIELLILCAAVFLFLRRTTSADYGNYVFFWNVT